MKALEVLVRLAGVLGMALAAAYLFAVFLAFQPGFSELTYVLVGRSDQEFPLVALSAAIPYLLLIVHLGVRTQIGAMYLNRGRPVECIAYTSARLKVSLLRSSTEAAYHRLYLARALLQLNRYKEAIETLEPSVRPPKRFKSEFDALRIETYLRLDNLMRAKEVRDGLEVKRNEANGRAWAAAAEIAAREGDVKEFQRCLEHAEWSLPPNHARLTYARRVAAFRGLIEAPTAQDAEAFLMTVPGARLEWCVMTGQAHVTDTADERSKWVAAQNEKDNGADIGRTDQSGPP